MKGTLDELRNELDELDQALLELVARRKAISLKVGRIKRSYGRGTRDFARERVVIARARQRATQLGLSPAFAEQFMLSLIRSSLQIQEQARVSASTSGDGQRVLVIGGAGQMGRWFVQFLDTQGFEVEVADPAGPVHGFPYREVWNDGELDHDMFVIASPLTVTREILTTMVHAPPAGLVFDIGSVKTPLRTALTSLADAGGRVTSLHPMFGPDTDLLSGRHVIFIDVGVPEATRLARDLFSPTMARLVDMDLEVHDRLMAYVLGVSHAVNIAFFSALAESGEAARLLDDISSTTFDGQLAVARRVAAESPDLYFEIQTLNDYGKESLAALVTAVQRLQDTVVTNDRMEFTEMMVRGQMYLIDEEP